MEKVKISELPSFDKLRQEDRLFTHVPTFGEIGYIPSGLITQGGVAMRRWNMTQSTPVGEAVGDIGFLRELPNLLGLGCYLVDRNHGRRKLDPTNHYKFVSGLIRTRYSADQVEAILLNVQSENTERQAEFQLELTQLNNFREECKVIASALLE